MEKVFKLKLLSSLLNERIAVLKHDPQENLLAEEGYLVNPPITNYEFNFKKNIQANFFNDNSEVFQSIPPQINFAIKPASEETYPAFKGKYQFY